jgi:DNA polymerase-3 subunit delta
VTRLNPSEFERRGHEIEGQWCLLHGPDDYRKKEALDGALRRLASAAGGFFEPVTLDGSGLAAARLLESAQTASLFGSSVTVVRDLQEMQPGEQQVLAAGLDRIAPGALVLLVFSAEDKRRPHAALLRAVEKVGTVVAFEQPRDPEARRWVIQQAERLGSSIEPAAAAVLVQKVGTNLVDLNHEVEKLTLFASGEGTITPRHVEELTPRHLDEQVFHLVDALGTGRADRAILLLQDMLAAGNQRGQSLRIIGVLANHFRMVWHAKRLLEVGWRPGGQALTEEQAALVPHEAVRALAGSWRANKLARQARNFNWPRLASTLDSLVECDLAIKGGSDIKFTLETLVISLSTPPRMR